jgi:REP element-mobilizing transposase RayT
MTDAMAQMSPEVLQCFENYRNAHYHRMLDKGFGQCVLRNPSLSMIVADTILFFDGDRYDVDRFVVMPNHVHLLVAFRKEFDMRESLESILHYSATCINIELDRLGPFWQSEPFDHCLRHEKQFEWVQNYIKDNPRIAKLCNGNYHYWERTT